MTNNKQLYCVIELFAWWSRKCKKDYAGRRTPTDGRTTDEAPFNNDNSLFEHSAPVIALQIQKKMQNNITNAQNNTSFAKKRYKFVKTKK